jgi:hypothetical protein
MGTAMQQVQNLRSQLGKYKAEIQKSAKVGTNAVLTVSGGVIAGYCYADHPVVPGTNLPMAGALGAGLLLGAITGLFEDYSDPLAAIGSGLLSVVVAKEAEAYFRKP